MRATDLLVLGVAGVAIYFLLHQGKELTDDTSNTIANLWLALFPNPPAMNLLGSVAFPDGNTVALSALEIRSDAYGNVFTKYAGHLYQLQPSDAFGNWPAVLVA